MNNLRWEPYLLASCLKAEGLLQKHFLGEKRLLFILAKGFDIRMNFVLKRLLELCPDINIECWLICFNEGEDSSSHKYAQRVQKNLDEFKLLMEGKNTKKNVLIYGKKKETVKEELEIEKLLPF